MPDPTDRPILFDGRVLTDGPITGVGRAFLDTLNAYVAIAHRPCELLTSKHWSGDIDPRVHVDRCLPAHPRRRRRRAMREAVRTREAALLHSPVVAIPSRIACPTIATVHDLPWLYPELRGEPGTRWPQRLALWLAVRRVDALIVPSQATRTDLLRLHPDAEHKTTVIPHGVQPVPATAPETADDAPFVVLGDDRPRKNHARIRRAHALARERCPDLPDLLFVGPPDRYVSEAEKQRLLRGARALVHCALLEGFGLPVVEAFAHGVPVVCSDGSSLPEVAGGCALTVDPRCPEAIAEALLRIHTDDALRRELRRKGATRAATLTPEHTAKAWLERHDHLRNGRPASPREPRGGFR